MQRRGFFKAVAGIAAAVGLKQTLEAEEPLLPRDGHYIDNGYREDLSHKIEYGPCCSGTIPMYNGGVVPCSGTFYN